jgi:hypothetical protein
MRTSEPASQVCRWQGGGEEEEEEDDDDDDEKEGIQAADGPSNLG